MTDRTIVIGGCRLGKTTAAALARHEWTRANPTGVVVELGPNGHRRVEKPITAADLVPELPAPEGQKP